MYSGKLVFAQIMDHLPLHTFRRIVAHYQGEHKVKRFSCLDQYLCMAFAIDLSDTVYALDATTIDLCLSVFPWAPFRSSKAAVKLHTSLDLRGNIPSFLYISDGKVHEVNIPDQLLPEAGAFYLMDRGLGLRARRRRQEASQSRCQPLSDPTNPEPHYVRANSPK